MTEDWRRVESASAQFPAQPLFLLKISLTFLLVGSRARIPGADEAGPDSRFQPQPLSRLRLAGAGGSLDGLK
jgi:hypothetical protein